ncbi:MAG TPA: hypothetical protein VK453_27645 [Micromonosporaceae bacterium]|nr:hypothetical protein [Micromonosporaceae bacterium]
MAQAAELPDEVNLAWSDQRLEVAMSALARHDPRPALAVLAATRSDYHRRALCVDVLGHVGQHLLPELRTLVEESNDDPDRWLLLGAALSAAGATARGADVIERTSDEQIDGMQRLTAQGSKALRRAARLAPQDPVPWAELQHCVMGSSDRGELDEVFSRVDRLAPDLYPANVIRLMTLTRKWYGSQEETLAFARARTVDLPPGHPLLALVPLAQIEGLVDLMMRGNAVTRVWRYMRFSTNKTVLAEVDAASHRLLADGATYRAHPAFMQAHQAFASYYHQVTEPRRARPHLECGGPRPAAMPWGYFGDAVEEFQAARKAAGLAVG